jgi:GGDEF domain-containing protein
MEYNLNRPWLSLDPWQKDYIETPPEQDCFLLCTRQGGKTTAMSIKAVELCVHDFKRGEVVLISSLTERQAQLMLAKAVAYAEECYPKQIATGRDKPTMHRLFFKNGAGILCYAAGDEGDSTRGYTIKKLFVDEGSRMKETYFTSATPTLSVSHGSMDIASTPYGTKNKYGEETFFYKCSKDKNFKKFYISAADCPRHDAEFLKKEQERMTKAQFSQEYLAQFLDQMLQFFPDELIKKVMTRKRNDIRHNGKIYCGVDVARMGKDDTVILSVEKQDDKIYQIDMEITNKTFLTDTVKRIIELNEKYDYSKIYIDTTGMGFGVFDPLLDIDDTKRKVVSIENDYRKLSHGEEGQRKKVPKEDLYNNLKILMEQGRIELFNDPEIEASLRSVQYEYTDNDLRIFTFNGHIAEALIRAAWCSKDKSLNIYYY